MEIYNKIPKLLGYTNGSCTVLTEYDDTWLAPNGIKIILTNNSYHFISKYMLSKILSEIRNDNLDDLLDDIKPIEKDIFEFKVRECVLFDYRTNLIDSMIDDKIVEVTGGYTSNGCIAGLNDRCFKMNSDNFYISNKMITISDEIFKMYEKSKIRKDYVFNYPYICDKLSEMWVKVLNNVINFYQIDEFYNLVIDYIEKENTDAKIDEKLFRYRICLDDNE